MKKVGDKVSIKNQEFIKCVNEEKIIKGLPIFDTEKELATILRVVPVCEGSKVFCVLCDLGECGRYDFSSGDIKNFFD